MQGEFRMITDLATVTPKELLFNYEELKAFLTEALQDYKTLVVTEESISDAKAKRAALNKLAENINAYRINVKKQLMAQYDEDFKPKCDELVAMTKEATDNISTQIKSIENAEKEAKLAEIRKAYDGIALGELKTFCAWETVYNPKWENKGFSIDAAVEEIRARVSRTAGDLAAIRVAGGPDTVPLLQWYMQTNDLSAVLCRASELKAMREREAARKRESEEKERNDAASAQQLESSNAAIGLEDSEPVTVIFKVVCTKAQLAALGEYMRKNGIQFGRA